MTDRGTVPVACATIASNHPVTSWLAKVQAVLKALSGRGLRASLHRAGSQPGAPAWAGHDGSNEQMFGAK